MPKVRHGENVQVAKQIFNIFFQEGEDAVHFANRVKAVIAARGGMSVLPW